MKYHVKGKKRHDSEFRQKYGIGLHQYQTILEEQNGVCYICGEKDFRNLAVDHDHATGKVRRLLCTSCNTGLGKFKDNPDLLRKAAEYVTQTFDLPEDAVINNIPQNQRTKWRLIIHTPDGVFSSAEAASRFYGVGATTIGIWCGVYDYYPSGRKREGFSFEKVHMTMDNIKEKYNVKD
jgi:hypothetical protein